MSKESVEKQSNPLVAKTNTVRNLLEKSRDQIMMALPKHMEVDKLIRVVMTNIQQNPKLLECTPISLVGAVMQSAQLGLSLDPILGHAYLVPRRNNKKGATEANFQVGYKGLIELMMRSGKVEAVTAHIAYSNEEVTLEFGVDEKLLHTPKPPSERGEMVGVYAVAFLPNGRTKFEWLWKEDVDKIKKFVQASYGPWVDHEDEMIRKTAVRRLAKFSPLSIELTKAVAIDEMNEAGVSTRELFIDDVEIIHPTKKTIDEALVAAVEQAEDVADENEEIVVDDSNDDEVSSKHDKELQAVIDKIKAHKIGILTPYMVRALGKQAELDKLTITEAKKVLADIEKVKGK